MLYDTNVNKRLTSVGLFFYFQMYKVGPTFLNKNRNCSGSL